jgi:hypothetical protein
MVTTGCWRTRYYWFAELVLLSTRNLLLEQLELLEQLDYLEQLVHKD